MAGQVTRPEQSGGQFDGPSAYRRQGLRSEQFARRLGVVAFMSGVAGMLMGSETWAQTASAPFVFEGQELRIDTPGWVSDGDYLVKTTAFINVVDGADAHIRGNIDAAPGSRDGLFKLGGGTLRLSGETSYLGSTRLLQGSLHVDGPRVFSVWSGIEAIRGTSLEYSDGVNVSRPLTLHPHTIADYLPPSRYDDVTPPAGMEQVVRWKVNEGVAVHSGLLQGSAPFLKQGQGLLDIRGDAMAYTGSGRVAQGALAINEIFSGSVNVGAGARLQGTGLVGAVHVERGGTLAPGNAGFGAASPSMPGSEAASAAIGTLNISRDIHFDPGSRFEVDATATGQSDTVWVGGKALLDGEVAVLARKGIWQASTSYEILSAQGGFEGTEFASVTTDLAFLTPSLSYNDGTVTLALARNDRPIEDVGETPDEEEVGSIIDEDVPGETNEPTDPGTEPPKSHPDLNDGLAGQDEESARQALSQLTGSWNASLLSSLWDDSRFVREAVLRRSMAVTASQLGGAAAMQPASRRPASHEPSSPQTPSGLTPWAEAFYSDRIRDGMNGILGDTRQVQGLMIGIAAAVSTYWHIGAFLGAQHSALDRDQGLAQADIDTTHAGLSMAGAIGSLRVALGLARSWHHLKSSRLLRAGTLRDLLGARYRGDTTQAFGEVEWPLFEHNGHSAEQRLSVAPFARLAWVRTGLDGFVETGGPAALDVRPASMAGWLTTLGLRLEAHAESLSTDTTAQGAGASGAKLYTQLAWHHAGNVHAESTQSFRDSATHTLFTSQGLTPARHSWSLQLGLDASVSKTASVGFAYLGRYGSGLSDHGIGGWARIAF